MVKLYRRMSLHAAVVIDFFPLKLNSKTLPKIQTKITVIAPQFWNCPLVGLLCLAIFHKSWTIHTSHLKILCTEHSYTKEDTLVKFSNGLYTVFDVTWLSDLWRRVSLSSSYLCLMYFWALLCFVFLMFESFGQ